MKKKNRLEFISRAESNPLGLPESDLFSLLSWHPNDEYPLEVTFHSGTTYRYDVRELVHDDLEMIWDRLTTGWKGLTPGQIFFRYVRGKCPYKQIK